MSTPTPQKNIVQVLGDAFAFVRSAETNQAIAAVTLDLLINDQIARNGETADANNAKYDPYSFDPNATVPAGNAPITPATYGGGSDLNAPTKIARILAIKNSVQSVVDTLKATPEADLADLLASSDTESDPTISAQEEVVG